MKLLIDTILKNNPHRDEILPIKDASAITIDGLVYFFGGTVENNISDTVFHYNLKTKETIKHATVPTNKEIVVLLKDESLIAINNAGEVFVENEDTWTFQGYINISANSCGIITEDKRYIISDRFLYEFNNQSINKVVESETISVDNYIPSTDKGIVYFKNSTVNLNNSEIYENTNQGDYIIYGKPCTATKDNVIIDKTNTYLITYNSPLDTIQYKTASSDNWFKDNINKTGNRFNTIAHIIPRDNKIFFAETKSTSHNAYSLSLNNNDVKRVDSIERVNNSYSKNINYNHPVPYLILYKDTAVFMGNGGYYKDNGIYDNSVYHNGRVMTKLSLNIKNPIYRTGNNTVFIFNHEDTSIYEYSFSGRILNIIKVPIKQNIKDVSINNGKVNISSDKSSYVYDINRKKIIGNVSHVDCIASTMSDNFVFVISKTDSLKMKKISLLSEYNIELNLPMVDDYKNIKIYSNGDNQLIMYVEKENYDWTMYRIVFDE